MLADFPDLSREYILIVDDEPGNLEVAQATLELLYNARVVAVSNGPAALDILADGVRTSSSTEPRSDPADWNSRSGPAEITIILSDLMMPGMTGFDLLPKLRERTRVPIIALTASAMTHDKDQALAAGFDGFIPKPFEADRLAADISACIAEIRANRSQPESVVAVVAPRDQALPASTAALLSATVMPTAPQPDQPVA